jgi:hypothetical protein
VEIELLSKVWAKSVRQLVVIGASGRILGSWAACLSGSPRGEHASREQVVYLSDVYTCKGHCFQCVTFASPVITIAFYKPCFLPTLMKASIARSRCSRVWAAEI